MVIVTVALLANETIASEIRLSKLSPRQGETVQVFISVPSGRANAVPFLQFNGHNYQVFPGAEKLDPSAKLSGQSFVDSLGQFKNTDEADRDLQCAFEANGIGTQAGGLSLYRALIAIPADLPPGQYTMRFGKEAQQMVVLPGLFATQKIRLPRSKVELKPSYGEVEAIDKAKKTLSPGRLWQGPFQPPSKARVSTGFGLRRIVNGKLQKDYFHSGVDYAAGLGAPVKAVAAGKVLLAAKGFRLHGNTVCLDHGQGVVSIYIHLEKILVKVGEMVKAQDVIGKVGQTGRANGPHLHFSLYVNEVATNPLFWFKGGF